MNATTGADDFAQKADEYLTQELTAERFMGSVMVAASNKIIFIKAYGLANREHEIPNAPNTRFRIGSITKQFTAICILKLQEQGKLSLDDPVSRFVENCPAHWSQIKIRHLLAHTSGIPSYTGFPDYYRISKLRWPPEKMVERIYAKPLEFDPGERYKYSNSGYFLLGYIVARTSGSRYEDYLDEAIFKPLGMINSGYDHFERILPHRATGYSRDDDRWKNSAYTDTSVPYAAGALYSTAEDFFLWYQCWRERKILSEPSWKAMTTPATNGYGFGINVSKQFGHRVLGHGGSVNGFNSSMSWFPDADLFICAFANADINSVRSDIVVKNLAALRFNKPIELPKQRNAVKLNPDQLKSLVGRYELKPNFILTVTVLTNRLFVQATGQSKFELLAESETNFFGRVLDTEITFCRNSAGNVTHLVLLQNGHHEAKRLRD
jgi:CubicO group peptidase (beta-lactamase class C family)